ncbi:MAG: indole-3-glycerol phosphate synthase TrpC [Endomicrobium sp.]|jgi:indole-3-glycerol phosphate synthase|nr:indole-3-glycerol phosphate synthase TrpC [Endomicrobium sp.]
MILDKIVAAAKARVEREKSIKPFAGVKREAESSKRDIVPFGKALKKGDISFICEVKKASPSKGLISADFKYKDIAADYESAGADSISVLTEPDFFLGGNEYLTEIKKETKLPVLRKDFIIDAYQIYEAKNIGADAVLLICAALDFDVLKKFLEIARAIGLSCLAEAHDEKEIETVLKAGAEIVGVNNRNLKTFEVNINNSVNLRKYVPADKIFVSESGIKTREHVQALRDNKIDAVLIGEELMRSGNVKEKMRELRGK